LGRLRAKHPEALRLAVNQSSIGIEPEDANLYAVELRGKQSD
jgi:hypothetical protein